MRQLPVFVVLIIVTVVSGMTPAPVQAQGKHTIKLL